MQQLLAFLNKLEETHIYYRLNKVREEAIMVEISVPGQRWEVEFMEDGSVDIEKFISDGQIFDSEEINQLFLEFSE